MCASSYVSTCLFSLLQKLKAALVYWVQSGCSDNGNTVWCKMCFEVEFGTRSLSEKVMPIKSHAWFQKYIMDKGLIHWWHPRQIPESFSGMARQPAWIVRHARPPVTTVTSIMRRWRLYGVVSGRDNLQILHQLIGGCGGCAPFVQFIIGTGHEKIKIFYYTPSLTKLCSDLCFSIRSQNFAQTSALAY